MSNGDEPDADLDDLEATALRPEATASRKDEGLDATAVADPSCPRPSSSRLTPTKRLGWRVGDQVAGHVILEKLGKGSCGGVYLVEHLETRTRRALKAIPDPGEAERRSFEREVNAQSLAGIHPNVAALFEAGEWEGTLYLLLEHLPGGSLREQIFREGPLEAAQAASVLASVADGLAAVHARGLLHCDVKPANVMFDEQGEPKLVDFGLAGTGQLADLPPGVLLGTPAYMAPEQTRTGGASPLCARTDVYGLGGTLYTALTGELPYDCRELMRLLLEIAACDPIAPSARRPELGIPAELDAIVLKAMARDRADRYASAEEFAASLRDFLGGGPSRLLE